MCRNERAPAAARKKRGIVSLLLVVVLLATGLSVGADSTGKSYVYGAAVFEMMDFSSPIPDPYTTLRLSDPSLQLSAPTDMCMVDGYLYILNSINANQYGGVNANGRVVVTDQDLNLVREIFITDAEGNPYTVQSNKNEPLSLIEPRGIWVDPARGENGRLYIADRSGHKILECDLLTGVVLFERGMPENEQIYASLLGEEASNENARATVHEKYLPCNIRTNSVGDIYIRAENDYRGLIRLSSDWEFISYFGAAQVQAQGVGLAMLWRGIGELFGADWAMIQFIPDEYANFTIDNDDIVYAVRPSSQQNADMLLKLNHLAVNINRSRDEMFYGDPGSPHVRGVQQSTSFNAVTVDDYGFISILDKTRKRIFQYAPEGWELFAFGGEGVQAGTFVEPVALETRNNNLYVLDKSTATVTMLQPTHFANTLRQGQILYTEGKMEEALEYYLELIRLCPNYFFAYRVVGHALNDMGRFEEAMDYYRMIPRGRADENYSNAFRQYRSQIIQDNFEWVFVVFLLLLLLGFIWGFLKKRGILIVKKVKLDSNNKFKYLLHCLIHPIDGFSEMRYNRRQSLLLANICMTFFIFCNILSITFWGFQFGGMGGEGFLILYLLAFTLVYYFMFVLVNWLLGTFLVGKGTFRQLWINISYALVPLSVSILISTLLSQILTIEEGAIISYVDIIGVVWTYILIFFGVKEAHMYKFLRALLSILFTLIGILIVVFLIILVISLAMQLLGFVGAVYDEALYRIRFR